MKKTAIFLLVVIFMLSLFGCNTKNPTNENTPSATAGSLSDSQTETQIPSTAQSTQPKTEAASAIKLTPAEAVKIYKDNSHLWQKDIDEFYMAGFYYLFLDLDFDGVLELITTEVQGTGRFSINKFFRINPDDNSVSEISFAEENAGHDDCDFYMEDSPILLKNKATGEYQYIVKDFVRAGGGMYYTSEEELNFTDGMISQKPLFGYEIIEAEVSGTGEDIEYYSVYSLEDDSKVDKATYDKMRADYFDGFTDLDLDLETIDGYDYHEATDSEKLDILLDSYTDFSYYGFEFED